MESSETMQTFSSLWNFITFAWGTRKTSNNGVRASLRFLDPVLFDSSILSNRDSKIRRAPRLVEFFQSSNTAAGHPGGVAEVLWQLH